MIAFLKKYSFILLIFVSTVCMVLFIYWTPPLLSQEAVSSLPLIGRLPGDLPQYIIRFALSSILFGIVPLITAFSLGENRKSLGLILPRGFFSWKTFLALIGGSVAFGVITSFQKDLSSYYPYSKTVLHAVNGGGWYFFIFHALGYFFLYYVPWEILFRGVLLFPLIRLAAGERELSLRDPLIMALACIQVIPSSIVHMGHPLSETLGAIPFGIFAAVIAVRSRSIVPALLVHALVGISLDFCLVIRYTGS